MIETLVFVYLGMAAAQFLWSLVVYTKVGHAENMKEAYIEGAQDAYKKQFGIPYDWSNSKLNRYLSIMYCVAIIRECVIQGLEWPLEVLWAIKYEFKGAE